MLQSLPQQYQDIVNIMHLVSTIKLLLQKLRDDVYKSLLGNVIIFSVSNAIDISYWNSHV